MAPGIVHEHVQALVRSLDFFHCFTPGVRLRHVQVHRLRLRRKLCCQCLGLRPSFSHPEINKIGRRFRNESSRDGLPQSAVGPGNENDPARAHVEKWAPITCWLQPATLTNSEPPPCS